VASTASIALQPDGKIVGAFESDASNVPTVFRLNADGSVDGDFGTGGQLALSLLGGTVRSVERTFVAPDGTIYVVGSVTVASDDRDAIWAVTPAGAPKASFNGTGSKLLPTFGTGDNNFGDAAITPAGEVAVATGVTSGAYPNIGLRVVSTTGGIPVISGQGLGSCELAPTAIHVTPAGDIIVGAQASCTGFSFGAIFKSNSAGVFDASFGDSGFQFFGVLGNIAGSPSRLFELPGRIGAVGQVGYAAAVSSYLPNGDTIPPIFGGLRSLPLGSSYAALIDGGAAAGGKIVGVGVTLGDENLPFIARYNPDGSPDASFAPGGVARFPLANSYIGGYTRLPDGKYLLLAFTEDSHIRLARIWGDSPAPQPATVAFAASVKSKSKAKKTKKFAGTAGGTGVTKVELAIQKVDSKLLKKSKKCSYVKGKSGTTKNFKAVAGKCAPGAWLAASGTGVWSLKLSKALKPGKYVLSARSTGVLGVSPVITKSITLTK
jgi:uncharacterized delta-60 repeat protein